MKKEILELYSLLDSKQKNKFYLMQILVIAMSLVELLSVLSIAPFMSLIGDMSKLNQEGIFKEIYTFSALNDEYSFLFLLGFISLLILFISSVFNMYVTHKLAMLGAKIGSDLSSVLFKYYMTQPWMFHVNRNSSSYMNNISQQCMRVTNGIILPFMDLNSKVVSSFVITLAIIIYNPLVAMVGILFLLFLYLLLYKIVRVKLIESDNSILKAQAKRFSLMAEGFGSIKDTILMDKQRYFVSRFTDEGEKFAKAVGTTQSISKVPRYCVEFLAYGLIISLILFLIWQSNGNVSTVLSVVSIYAIAAFKMLPAFQNIYVSITTIKGNLSSFESIKSDVRGAMDTENLELHSKRKMIIPFVEQLSFKDVSFSYPSSAKKAIDDLSLEIKANSVVGFVGASGSGKSTLIDIILGLIEADSGSLSVDGVPVGKEERKGWQKRIGYVPQSIFLTDSTVRQNIAFGVHPSDIDEDKLNRAIEMAHLSDFISELPDGVETKVGERGVQLSGGQKQRIGIARALFNDPDVLIFDEATSALDGITEKLIMNTINDFIGKKTIVIIAHRLGTVKNCDQIFLIKKGKLVDQGSYLELSKSSEEFRNMIQHQ